MSETCPNFIFLDLNMPGKTGFEVLKDNPFITRLFAAGPYL
ncbi:MAG: hypothetical protein EOO51_07935 [Flavobacterium sp.]|nr:MAG: hypothetical protein EOO51_07935 [Flavobacterium sp.]